MKLANIIEKNAGIVNTSLYNPDETSSDDPKYENFTKLFNMIRLKDLVSEYLWFALTGALVCSISYNYIQNTGCARSVEEMKKTHDDYLKQEQEIAEHKTAQEKNPTTVYKSFE